ncbi:sigma-70 family RNA polymerase sigma factor [Streptomyces clavuligerus]|uniref:RNA polymerase sigma factor n=1 Tax=Streptomyces clavuligerus TaxID=1901 RepID=D5SKY3_STRCL|nr:sigma-70 family RNA polymerase sigma factor [Streptomyces clavuligerus]ANW22463.1 RNA polymerase subunit sigma [Streptomyces clavuligerus]AXU17367.1 sigma-70 family RNA polymerase sigma factor [Streptomyces clavuligerus]EFG04576.1 RNA polymerase sigma factor [Streptomyces clavuligerus]MBY6306976.1 sigma-70 family RNA polymerase sigma factor [Streptomyces clavuligerus]QCS10440.1 RNA polymerase subunit sigma [Streptomyces clavuligerus]
MAYATDETIRELYRLHSGYLLRTLLKVTKGDRGRAEDILQETMTRAWRHPESFAASGVARCRPWLCTVARRIAIDKHRWTTARPREVPQEERSREPAAPGNAFDDTVCFIDTERLLTRLAPHHREVLVQLHLYGRSMAQTAEALGIPVGTVKSRSFTAVRALRPILAAERRQPTVTSN